MIKRTSAPPCYLHMTSPEASVAKKKIKERKKKDRLSKQIWVQHVKAELQDRDVFHRVISDKGHMCAYKIIPESSAFVPQPSPNGAIVPLGQLAPWLQPHDIGIPGPGWPGSPPGASPGPGQPATSPGKSICREPPPGRNEVSAPNFGHGEKRAAGTVGTSSLPFHPMCFSGLSK